MGYKKYAADINYTQASLQADSYNYPHYGLYLHQYFNMPEPTPGFYRNYNFPNIFNQKTIDSWIGQADSLREQGTSMSIRKVAAGERNTDEMYEFLKLEVLTPAGLKLPADVYLGLSPDHSPEIFYLLAFKKGNSKFSDLLLGRDAETKLLCDLPKKVKTDLYRAKMCWIENGVPKSITLPQKITL